MDWRDGWTSAWPEPLRWPEPLQGVDSENDTTTRVVDHRFHFKRERGSSTFRLMSLPDELLAGLTMMILMVDTKGS